MSQFTHQITNPTPNNFTRTKKKIFREKESKIQVKSPYSGEKLKLGFSIISHSTIAVILSLLCWNYNWEKLFNNGDNSSDNWRRSCSLRCSFCFRACLGGRRCRGKISDFSNFLGFLIASLCIWFRRDWLIVLFEFGEIIEGCRASSCEIMCWSAGMYGDGEMAWFGIFNSYFCWFGFY